MKTHPLTELSGRLVQCNKDDVAEIVSAWAVMQPEKLGVTVVGYEPHAYAVFRLSDGRLITDTMQYKTLLPKGDVNAKSEAKCGQVACNICGDRNCPEPNQKH